MADIDKIAGNDLSLLTIKRNLFPVKWFTSRNFNLMGTKIAENDLITDY